MTEAREIQAAARRLLHRINGHLLTAFPDGNFEQYPYYRLDLQHFIQGLEGLASGRHKFGWYLIGNTYEGTRFVNVGTDLFTTFCHFLVNGVRADWGYLNNEKRNEYTMRYTECPQIHWEHLAIHEVIGYYIKKVKPGIQRYYYDLE